mmetsp:Transcript_12622/g.36675  ORF Transcript_12622/g.36675 Transcript_12622/m.36675 type:complete len:146 (-) Transcript_12622:803-1240(-)
MRLHAQTRTPSKARGRRAGKIVSLITSSIPSVCAASELTTLSTHTHTNPHHTRRPACPLSVITPVTGSSTRMLCTCAWPPNQHDNGPRGRKAVQREWERQMGKTDRHGSTSVIGRASCHVYGFLHWVDHKAHRKRHVGSSRGGGQ